MERKALTTPDSAARVRARIADSILEFVTKIPSTDEPKSDAPADRVRSIARDASIKAAITAGSLAVPPGAAGWLTILPELVAIWRIQLQMVADIAGAFGKQASLTREQMLFCLFRHTAAQAVRDLVIRVGERSLVRRVPLRAAQAVAKRIGVRITQRAIGKGVARWLPIIGAVGVAGYAYYDTAQVARTATKLFQREIVAEPDIEPGPEPSDEVGPPP